MKVVEDLDLSLKGLIEDLGLSSIEVVEGLSLIEAVEGLKVLSLEALIPDPINLL